MGPPSVIAAALAVGSAFLPVAAQAGAFTLKPGEAKLFITSQLNSGDEYFDRKGKKRARGLYSKQDHQIYGEYGVVDGLTAFGAIAYQRIKVKDLGTSKREGLGRSEVGARFRLFERDGWIIAAQGSAIFAGAKESPKITVVGETDDQADVRGLVAYSFKMFDRWAFVDLGAGYRLRGGDPADEWRVDATFGIRPMDRLLLMVQSFNQMGTERWSGPYQLKQRIHKIQIGGMYELTETLSLIAAGVFSPFGRDSLNEKGVTLGIGLRF